MDEASSRVTRCDPTSAVRDEVAAPGVLQLLTEVQAPLETVNPSLSGVPILDEVVADP